LYISNDYAYILDEDLGLQIIDTSDPTDLNLIGEYKDIPKDQRNIFVFDNYAYIYTFVDRKAVLLVIDVSNPAKPIFVGKYNINGDITGYSHNIYVSGDYVYVSDSYSLQIFKIKRVN